MMAKNLCVGNQKGIPGLSAAPLVERTKGE